VDGTLNGKRYLIHDRDLLFTAQSESMLTSDRSVNWQVEPSNHTSYHGTSLYGLPTRRDPAFRPSV